MSLRLKIVLALTLLAAGATAAIGIVSYTSTKHELEAVSYTHLTLPTSDLV